MDKSTIVIERINVFLKQYGISKASLARDFNMNQSKVNGYFMTEGASKRSMPISFLAILADEYPQLDLNVIFRGTQSAHPSIEATPSNTNEIELLNRRIANLTKQNLALAESVNLLSKIISETKESKS